MDLQMQSLLCVLSCALFFLISVSDARADSFVDIPLDQAHCQTFSVGESGHSERCRGPLGYGLIVHDRRSRVDIEILYPGEERGAKVHRLVNFLGDGQRYLALPSIRWLTSGEGENAKAVAFSMRFDVEPQAYELFIPLTLVFRMEKGERECVIATLSEGSKRKLDEVMKSYAKAKCRPAFPR